MSDLFNKIYSNKHVNNFLSLKSNFFNLESNKNNSVYNFVRYSLLDTVLLLLSVLLLLLLLLLNSNFLRWYSSNKLYIVNN